tara:strand:- start:1338 stop:1526 length:189 start_codon:yes stop_codon:yes gene_type:complete
MIKEQIDRLVSTLQALTFQRINALREGRQSEAQQIQSVAMDVDAKIQELEKVIRSSAQAVGR